MKLIWWMLSGSVLSAIILTTLLGEGARFELWLGMSGPLAAAIGSWIAMEHQHARRPAGLTGLLIKAFAAKMIFFAGYITALLSIGLVRPIPFVISFISYFIALHTVEAVGLRRLQAVNPDIPSGALQSQLRNG
jgi:hypothetical protein